MPDKSSPLKNVLINSFTTDDESVSRYQSSNDKVYSSNISQDYSIKPLSPISDKSSKQQSNSKTAQSNMLSDFQAAVKSTSVDGQIMPGHRLRQKASSVFDLFN
jgi:hypothetical protein